MRIIAARAMAIAIMLLVLGLIGAVVLASGYSHVLAKNGTYGFELLHKPYSARQLSHILQRVTGGRGGP